jgi:hypothetical protein
LSECIARPSRRSCGAPVARRLHPDAGGIFLLGGRKGFGQVRGESPRG